MNEFTAFKNIQRIMAEHDYDDYADELQAQEPLNQGLLLPATEENTDADISK